MRYIVVQKPVELKDPMTGEPAGRTYTFKEFLSQMLLDGKWGRSAADIFCAADIRQKLSESGEPGGVIQLSDGEWERLSSVIKEPSNPYSPVLVVQVTEFLRAVIEAPTQRPGA